MVLERGRCEGIDGSFPTKTRVAQAVSCFTASVGTAKWPWHGAQLTLVSCLRISGG